jgi:hypothetical protein
MRISLPILLASITAAGCAVDPADPTAGDVSASASDVRINPATDATEPAYVNGVKCTMVFPGGLTPQTQVYQIWPVGTHGIVNTPYNTARPNLYAVFGTGAAAGDNHHVDGFSQFDHYHILDNRYGTDVDNTKWDLMAVFPGPNFNAATYNTAHSVAEMNAQQAAGILGPTLTTPDIGFPAAVLFAPVNCPRRY